MRLYVPATLPTLAADGGFRPRSAYAVTADLAAALPGEDQEALEYAAFLAAADESVDLVASDDSAPRRRVVVVAELPGPVPPAEPCAHPGAVRPPGAIPWDRVVSLHVDDESAEADVAAAAAGDAEALERAAERDLLWYDVSEIAAIRRP